MDHTQAPWHGTGTQSGDRYGPGQFRPGPSANPFGRKSRRLRIAAEVERIAAWLGRELSPIEFVLVRQLANLSLMRPTVETARVAGRITKQLATTLVAAKPQDNRQSLAEHLATKYEAPP
jgi:hypothetical protein